MREMGRFLTRAPLRSGGGADSPPVGFLDSSKTAADIDTDMSVLSSASIWHLPSKLKKNVKKLEKMAF